MKAYIFVRGDWILCYKDGVYFWIDGNEKGPARKINVVCKTNRIEAEKYAKKIGAEIMEICTE